MAGVTTVVFPHVVIIFGEREEGLFLVVIIYRCINHFLEVHRLMGVEEKVFSLEEEV